MKATLTSVKSYTYSELELGVSKNGNHFALLSLTEGVAPSDGLFDKSRITRLSLRSQAVNQSTYNFVKAVFFSSENDAKEYVEALRAGYALEVTNDEANERQKVKLSYKKGGYTEMPDISLVRASIAVPPHLTTRIDENGHESYYMNGDVPKVYDTESAYMLAYVDDDGNTVVSESGGNVDDYLLRRYRRALEDAIYIDLEVYKKSLQSSEVKEQNDLEKRVSMLL